jgi:Protein of unknown function (DUF3099)
VKRHRRPVLITDARQSPKAELRYREIRYVLMMSLRAVSLVVAAVLVSARVPLLWLWLPICFFCMLVVPWLAVIWANDRLPKKRLGFRPNQRAGADEPAALSPAEAPRVIDADE